MKILFAVVGASLAISAAASAQEKITITPELVAAAEKEGELTLQYSSPLAALQAMVPSFA